MDEDRVEEYQARFLQGLTEHTSVALQQLVVLLCKAITNEEDCSTVDYIYGGYNRHERLRLYAAELKRRGEQ